MGSVCSSSSGQPPARAQISQSTELLHRAACGLIFPAENRTLLPTLSYTFSASSIPFPSAAAGFAWAQTLLLRTEIGGSESVAPSQKKKKKKSLY